MDNALNIWAILWEAAKKNQSPRLLILDIQVKEYFHFNFHVLFLLILSKAYYNSSYHMGHMKIYLIISGKQ